MTTKEFMLRAIVTASAVALTSIGGVATAQSSSAQDATTGTSPAKSRTQESEAKGAAQQVRDAATVVQRMERDTGMRQLLQQAQGVFIVPKYGRAALIAGAVAGEGVMLVKQEGKWSDPAFYNIGGVSLGLQAGAEGGPIVLVLNNQKAVDSFMRDNNWSLNAEAGLTVVNWSPKAQASAGRGDVVVWADTKGLMGDLAVSLTDIRFDQEETATFYGQKVSMREVFSGTVKAPAPQVAALKRVLPDGTGATSSGSSSGATSSGATSGSSGASPQSK